MHAGGLPAGRIRPGSTGAHRPTPQAVPRGDEQREILEAVRVRAPDDRADDLEGRRDADEDEDLYADVPRLQPQHDREEGPGRNAQGGVLERRCARVEREDDRGERRERGDEDHRPSRGDRRQRPRRRAQSVRTVLILSPTLMPRTTSIPEVTLPKFVYWPLRCGASASTT